MNGRILSSETIHASTVAVNGRAVLITGPSGSGKSDLTLRLLDRGFALVSDDQTIVARVAGMLVAKPPANIAGKMEIRGIGIVEMPHVTEAPVALVVELTNSIERMPEHGRDRTILGVAVPLVSIDSTTASAASKVAIALDHLGLKFQ